MHLIDGALKVARNFASPSPANLSMTWATPEPIAAGIQIAVYSSTGYRRFTNVQVMITRIP